MKKSIFLYSLLVVGLASCGTTTSGFTSTSNNISSSEEEYIFTVTFKNYDGTILYETTCGLEDSVTYAGPEPTKPADGYVSYEFIGWDEKVLQSIHKDTTLIASYNEVYDTSNPEYTNGRFKFTSVPGGYEITSYYGFIISSDDNKANKCLVLPSTYEGIPVVSIAANAFYEKEDFTTIKFGSNLKTIGDWAFCNCNLKSLEFNEGLTSIGTNSFKHNYSLRTITFPSTLQKIGDYAFQGIGETYEAHSYSFTLPASLTYVGNAAFYSSNKFGVLFDIYCKSSSKPSGWSNDWALASGMYTSKKTYHNVHWGS